MLVPVPDYLRQPPAYFHTRILVGPGAFLTPKFVYERGISSVINCAFPGDSPEWFRTKYPDRYTCLSAPDSPNANILDWYFLFEGILRMCLRRDTGIVYVHCQAGINRSAFLALTYVCSRFHMDGETMLEALKRQRPCMFQNAVYRRQVLTFLNGCVPGAQNPGDSLRVANDGDSGFRTPGSGPNLARLDVDTGRAPT
jgi:hypothetical protein